jgi:hypothetical protein
VNDYEIGQGRYSEESRQATIACYLGLWRMVKGAWPYVALWSAVFFILTA